jgi:hypothetical protein
MTNGCDYCQKLMFFPPKIAERLTEIFVEKYQNDNNKNNKYLPLITFFLKYSAECENIILRKLSYFRNKPRYSKMTSEQQYFYCTHYLNDVIRKQSNDIIVKCDFCGYNACDFHVSASYFQFWKCVQCNNNANICGWCMEKLNNDLYRPILCKLCTTII